MVNPREKCLEDVIVQVFEEQEDLFYFPVTTQKQARSFIKALHIKGIQYEDICEEIGEFEHNFSAWRKGLGRAGIGNRIIELINKPFQEILLSDSEDSDAGEPTGDTLNGRIQNVVKKSQTNGDSTPRPNIEERLPLHHDREVLKEKQTEITDSWMKKTEEKLAAVDANQKEPVSEEENSFTPTRELPKKQELKDDGFTLETVKLRPVSRKPAENPVVMREKKDGPFERTLSFREKLQKARQRESKTMSGTPKVDSTDSNGGSDRSSKSSEVSQTENDNMMHQENNMKEEVKPQINQENVLGNKCEELIKFDDEVENGKQEYKEEQNQVQHAEIIDLPEDNSSSDEADGKDTETTSSSGSTNSQEDDDNDDDDDDGDDGDDDDDDEDDTANIDENYDSDYDQDSQDSATELGSLLKRLAALKEQASDGPGFIYVFSDSVISQSDNTHRVKIGASRFPNKRLEQAKRFNVDLKLVSAIAVSPRQRALDAIHTQLDEQEMRGLSGWFSASLDEVLHTVSKIAEKFPSESSDC